MHFKFRHLEKIVGAFFLFTCAMILVLLVLVARGQRWFQAYTPYDTYFDGGGGLRVGTPVMVKGLEGGKISGIELCEDGRVRIDLSIFRQVGRRIRSGSMARISSPLLGSSSLEIDPGPQDLPPIPHGGTIPSEESASAGFDALVDSATKLVRSLDDPEGDLKMSLANVNIATKQLSDALTKKDGTLRMLIERRQLYDELVRASGHLSGVLGAIDEKGPDIQDAIVEARRALEEANKVIAALQKSIFLRGNIAKGLKEDSTLRSEGRAP